jgi:ribosomal protein L14E/L6E/L27E
MKSMQNPLVPGQLVKSKSGHDKGYVFFVIEVIDDDYVLIADGDRRKSEKPKKKKVKHLQPYDSINSNIAEKLAQGLRLDNMELQRELEKSGVIELTVTN